MTMKDPYQDDLTPVEAELIAEGMTFKEIIAVRKTTQKLQGNDGNGFYYQIQFGVQGHKLFEEAMKEYMNA